MSAIDTTQPALTLGEEPAAEGAVALRQEGQQPVTAPAATPNALLEAFMQLARDPSVRPEVLTTLAGMQERAEDRQAEREFNQAMFRVQKQLKPMIKKGLVSLGEGKGGYKFLRREDLDAELRPIYEAEGFSLSFTQRAAASGGLIIYIKVRHSGGHSETNEMELPADTGPGRSPLQARVSTISFAERVLTEMAFNVVRADDNGVAGGKRFVTQPQAAEIVHLLGVAGRQEATFLPRMCTDVRSAEEIEEKDFIRVKGALQEIIEMRKAKTGAQ
jgi:hypothetical protein